MKSAKEILKILVDELIRHLENGKAASTESYYYNKVLGSTSFLLAGLLETLLRENYDLDWNSRLHWIDDSLITRIDLSQNKLTIEGVMIWGKRGVTEEWVDPFLFEIEPFDQTTPCRRFSFHFCDALSSSNLTYEDYKKAPKNGNLQEVSWKYNIIS